MYPDYPNIHSHIVLGKLFINADYNEHDVDDDDEMD